MERLTRVFAETTHGTKGYEAVNKIKVDTESIHNLSEIITTLGKIEDVLEKYGVENLDDFIKEYSSRNIKLANDNYVLEQELAELKQKAIVLPKELQVGCKIFWANEDGVYSGKLYAVTKDINPDGCFNIWLYCLYDNGLSYSHLIEDFEVELFATREEAEQKLAEIGGKNE